MNNSNRSSRSGPSGGPRGHRGVVDGYAATPSPSLVSEAPAAAVHEGIPQGLHRRRGSLDRPPLPSPAAAGAGRHARRGSLGNPPPRLPAAASAMARGEATTGSVMLRRRKAAASPRWDVAAAVKANAARVEHMATWPIFEAMQPDSTCEDLVVEAARLSGVVERMLPQSFAVAGPAEQCLYQCFEETVGIKAALTEFSELEDAARQEAALVGELRQQLRIRAARLGSTSRLLVAHICSSALGGGVAKNEQVADADLDVSSLSLHPATRWFWLANFPAESSVPFNALLSACERQGEFGDLTRDAKRRLIDIARPAPSDDLRLSPRNVVSKFISLNDLDVLVREEGLASLTLLGSSPFVAVEPRWDGEPSPSRGELRPQVSAAPLKVSPNELLREVRRLLPEARQGGAYQFMCHGLPVTASEESFVRLCDVCPVRLRAVPASTPRAGQPTAESSSQIPFATMFQRRIEAFEQPQKWSRNGPVAGIHVLVDPFPESPRESAGQLPSATLLEVGEDEGSNDEGWHLDVVLVPGVRTGEHRRFFWEENGLIDHLQTELCGGRRVRILGVEHRAAGLESSVWIGQTTAQHTSSTVGVLQRLLAVGVGDRPVVFVTDNVGSLIVQQLLLLPCSSQSRDVTQDAVAICEASLAMIHFAAPMVGLAESCSYGAQKLSKLLPAVQHLGGVQQHKQQELQEKVAYVSLIQDEFAFAQRSERCLKGLVRLHITFQPLDRPHLALGTGVFAERVLHYGPGEYALQFPRRTADSVSRPCSRTLGQVEEPDDKILQEVVTDALRCAAAAATGAFARLTAESSAESSAADGGSPSSPVSNARQLSPRTTPRTVSRRAPLIATQSVAGTDVTLHVSILLRGRTLQVLDGFADDISGLSQLPVISGAPKPFEFMFVALHVAVAEIVQWLGGDWAGFFTKVNRPSPSLVMHLFGETRQLCLAKSWLRHTLSLEDDSTAVLEHSRDGLRCIYDLDPCHALHDIFASVDRAAAVVKQFQTSETHSWWWTDSLEKEGVMPASSYARAITSTPKRISTPGARRSASRRSASDDVDSSSSDDEGNAVEGSTYARTVRRLHSVDDLSAMVADDELSPASEQKPLATTTTVAFLGRKGAGKTTLLALLLQDAHALLDSCDCESTQTTIRFCGCASAAEEEFMVEYMSVEEVDKTAAELNKEAEMMCMENGITLIDRFRDEPDPPDPPEAEPLRSFATSLQEARRGLSGDETMQQALGESVRPIRRVSLCPEQLGEATDLFKKYTQRDPEHETSNAAEIDLVCQVTVRLHLPALAHLTLLDTPGRSRAAGAHESHPREVLRKMATQQAIEAADCWIYLLPWFQKRGIDQLEEDMQCWRPYMLEAEGFVVLTRMAEDGYENDQEDDEESTRGVGSNSEAVALMAQFGQADESAEAAAVVSMESRLAEKREQIRMSRWCCKDLDERYTVSPTVSSSTGVLAGLIKQDPSFADDPAFEEEITNVVSRISGKLLVESTDATASAGHGFLKKLDKAHWADACLEVCGMANIAEILCGSATHYLAPRSVTDSVSVHLHMLVKDDVAIDKDLHESLQHLKAWDSQATLQSERMTLQSQIESGVQGANRLMQQMKDSAKDLYFAIFDQAEELLAQSQAAEAAQEKRIKKPNVQMELFQEFDMSIDRMATAQLGKQADRSRVPELLQGRFDRLIDDAAANAPDSPKSCAKPPRRSSVSLLLPTDSSAEFESVLENLQPLLDSVIQRIRIADTNSARMTDEHLRYDVSSAVFNSDKMASGDFVKEQLCIYDGQPMAGYPQGKPVGLGMHVQAIAHNATAHLWRFYKAVIRTLFDELSGVCGRQAEVSSQVDALCSLLGRADVMTITEDVKQAVVAETDARICRLIDLRRQLRRKEAEILTMCTDCLMLDVRNSIRDRAQVIAEDNRAHGGSEWRGADGAAAAMAAAGGGGRPRAISRSGSNREAMQAALEGLSESERRTWSLLEINFGEVKLDKRIGQGATGIVHRGTYQAQDVAIKIFKTQDDMDEDEIKDFREEVKHLFDTRCPYIVMMVGVCTVPPNMSIMTEYMPRGSLYDILHKQKGPVDFRRRMRMLLDAIKGMQYLMHRRIVHRDLKSQNLLVDRSFKVKVADFGLARMSRDTHVETVNGGAGTPGWMAPEVLRGEPFGSKADVYSFGVVVWETVVREVPWHGARNAQIVCSVGMREERLPLTHEAFTQHPYLKTLCTKCFSENPDARLDFEQICGAFTKFMQELLQLPVGASTAPPAPAPAPVPSPQPQLQPAPSPQPAPEPEPQSPPVVVVPVPAPEPEAEPGSEPEPEPAPEPEVEPAA